MPRLIKTISILFLVLITGALTYPSVSIAQSETSTDLVNEVNALRVSQGLDPYQIDPWLMAYAQEHSDYQAATQTSTHLHSDGTLPQDIGLQENVAGGDEGYVTVSVVVNQIWVDWGHRHILIDYPSGEIGAGIAAENGTVYYTVNIRSGQQASSVTPEPNTPVPFVPYLTSTPNEDGMIIHIVGEGQTLWSIAQSYGVTVDEIRQLNALPVDSTDIYPGQQLLIRMGITMTPAVDDTTPTGAAQPLINTALPSTKMPAPIRTIIPSPTLTLLPSPSATDKPAGIIPDIFLKNEDIGAWVILIIGIVGLMLVIIFGFRRSPKDDS